MKKPLSFLLLFPLFAYATPKITSSIYPIQQIANAISGTETDLLADSYLSPHSYSVTPKDAQKILDTDIVVWVGSAMMPQLDNYIIKREESGKTIITASQLPDIHLIKGAHHDHEHSHKHEDHNHNEHNHASHDKESLSYDPHLWLSPANARVIGKAIADELIKMDNKNNQRYLDNLNAFNDSLAVTEANINKQFKDNPPLPFFVFHDAYHYFEDTFGVKHSGVVTAHAGQSLRPKNIEEIQQKIKEHDKTCLFREPQFLAPIIDKLAIDGKIIVGELDPVGYQKQSKGYPVIIQNIADTIATCHK